MMVLFGSGIPSWSMVNLCRLELRLIKNVSHKSTLGHPLRLIRVESGLWTKLMDPDLDAPHQPPRPDALPTAGDRYADLLPAPQGEQVFQELVPGGDQGPKQRQVVPTVTGVGLSVKQWLAWRCWLAITMFPSGGMLSNGQRKIIS